MAPQPGALPADQPERAVNEPAPDPDPAVPSLNNGTLPLVATSVHSSALDGSELIKGPALATGAKKKRTRRGGKKQQQKHYQHQRKNQQTQRKICWPLLQTPKYALTVMATTGATTDSGVAGCGGLGNTATIFGKMTVPVSGTQIGRPLFDLV